MILRLSRYKKLFKNDLNNIVECDVNLKSEKIDEAINNSYYILNRGIRSIIGYLVTDKLSRRTNNIYKMTQDEFLYLKCNGLTDDDIIDVLENAVSILNFRIFISDKLDKEYEILVKDHSVSNYNYIVSIIIGNNFKDDSSFISLIYDISEKVLDAELKMKGIVYNRYDYNKDLIILPNHLSISDVNFFVKYYTLLFTIFLDNTDCYTTSHFDYLFNNHESIIIENKAIMDKVYNFAFNNYEMNNPVLTEDDNLVLEIYNLFYKK